MTRRQPLSEIQIAELFDPPTEQRELVRHYTLSETDLAGIRRYRGDHNRFGRALMLCYLRYPGRPLRAGERPPESLKRRLRERARRSLEQRLRTAHSRFRVTVCRPSPTTWARKNRRGIWQRNSGARRSEIRPIRLSRRPSIPSAS